MSDTQNEHVSAALLIIGNEILSGRTHDKNIPHIATKLTEIGVRLTEVRIVADEAEEIVAAVNRLRVRYNYLFTTGGIGPTHDDITAECVARAFGVTLTKHPEAMRRLTEHYERNGQPFNEMRQRMAMTPPGARLIDNPVSTAPGFIVDNVFVMAGVPRIMQAMLDNILPTLKGGAKVLSVTIVAALGEGTIASGLAEIQEQHPRVDIGSYPGYATGNFQTSLVARGTNADELEVVAEKIRTLIRELGGEPIESAS